MKLRSVTYNPESDKWYTFESLPDNKRDILVYSLDLGTTCAYYDEKVSLFWVYKWNQFIEPKYWREIPRYDSKVSLQG